MARIILYLSLHAGDLPEGSDWTDVQAWDWSGSRVSELVPVEFDDHDDCLIARAPRSSVVATCCASMWALFEVDTGSVPWLTGALPTALMAGDRFELCIDGIAFPAPPDATRVP